MVNQPSFPGCIIEARPIGLFRMVDKELNDDKILAGQGQIPCSRITTT
jgi:inorganic pyrophosphatase